MRPTVLAGFRGKLRLCLVLLKKQRQFGAGSYPRGGALRRVLAFLLFSIAGHPVYAADYQYGGDVEPWFPSLTGACQHYAQIYDSYRAGNYPFTRTIPDGGGWKCMVGNPYGSEEVASFVGRTGNGCLAPKIFDPLAQSCDLPPAPCPEGTARHSPLGTCVPVASPPGTESQQASNGPQCNGKIPAPNTGEPINPGNGNMWHIENDYATSAPGHLTLGRTYNSNPLSLDATRVNLFGNRWTSPYDAVLRQEVPTAQNAPVGQCIRFSDTNEIACHAPLVTAQAAIPDAVSVSRGDGKRIFFNRTASTWVSSSDVSDSITPVFNANASAVTGWIFKAAGADTTEQFDADGKLLSIVAADGTTRRMTYSVSGTYDTSVGKYPADAPSCTHLHPGTAVEGRLLCISDDWGRQLRFEYDANGRVVKMTDAAGEQYLYQYDGASGGCQYPSDPHSAAVCAANNLTSVIYPGNKTRTYRYNEAARINGGVACPGLVALRSGFGPLANALTGITDENGKRHITWTYDCTGRATSSQVAVDVEKVNLAYAAPDVDGNSVTTVTHATGTLQTPLSTVTRYNYSRVLGLSKNVSVDQNCVECGPIASRTYDANGNLSTITYWNGSQTRFTYDLNRNLETSRVEAFGTPQARTITTEWDPTLRKPATIAEPKRITRLTYFPNGQIKSRVELATNDTTGETGVAAVAVGIPSTWNYTYNSIQQIETIDGPRVDVADITRYAYDSATGNLASITNPLGHTTVMSNFDGNGRARRIDAPNGAMTNVVYSPLGWILSRSTTAGGVTQTTGYEYDNVGQVIRMVLPGGAAITFTYDDARRLTGIADNKGNTVSYTLDYLGNRIGEQVKDPGGSLVRQVARQYDALGRLLQQTGASQ